MPMACMIPCSTPTSPTGTSSSTAAVARTYERIETVPAMKIAGARSRAGSRISSPIVEASSTPTSALHITAKLVAVSQVTPVTAGASACTPAVRAAIAATITSTTLARLLIAADVVDPLADRGAADVGDGHEDQPAERQRGDEQLRSGEGLGPSLTAREREDPGHVDEQHRHVEEVGRPVAPAGEKAVRLAELLPDPQ